MTLTMKNSSVITPVASDGGICCLIPKVGPKQHCDEERKNPQIGQERCSDSRVCRPDLLL